MSLSGALTQTSSMLAPHPPYALASTSFRFANLAALAGRAPLGGQREVALATYLAARLLQDALPDRGLDAAARAERAVHAKQWLSTIALPNGIRAPLAALLEASSGNHMDAAAALHGVIDATADFLDRAARSELTELASALGTR